MITYIRALLEQRLVYVTLQYFRAHVRGKGPVCLLMWSTVFS